jgi:hypothetical protein
LSMRRRPWFTTHLLLFTAAVLKYVYYSYSKLPLVVFVADTGTPAPWNGYGDNADR